MWQIIDNGDSQNIGSEKGIIVLDEEHELGARVTLEKDCETAPWTITCGIYGSFFHTIFLSAEKEAKETFENLKTDIESILNEEDEDQYLEKIETLTEKYL